MKSFAILIRFDFSKIFLFEFTFVCFAASPEGGNWKKLDCGRKFCGRATDGAAPLGLRSQKFWLYHLFVFPATFQAKVQRFREDQNHWKHLYGGCRSATWQRGRKDGTNSKFLKQTSLGSGIRNYHSSSFQTHREHHYCGILVDFAIQLMTLLENINRDSFQRFQLRAGLNQVWKLNLATTTSTTKTFFLKFYRELLWLEW